MSTAQNTRTNGVALLALSLTLVAAIETTVRARVTTTAAAQDGDSPARALRNGLVGGHPRVPGFPPSASHPPGPRGDAQLPIDSPVISANYVNFESPPVKPLALSENGRRLFAANTPAGTLLIIDPFAPGTGLPKALREVPVGIEPVSVAVESGTPEPLVWVANYVSDDVTVVNGSTGEIVQVIPVGDEPVNILFHDESPYAYVVTQGSPADAVPPLVTTGHLITIDRVTHRAVHQLPLDSHTPRAADFDPIRNQIVIAAMHSGNNVVSVGQAVQMDRGPGGDPPTFFAHTLQLLKDFSVTADLFAAAAQFSPWPDPPTNPDLPPSPLVMRIVADIGEPGAWADMIDLLTLDNGQLDPAVVAQFNAEFGVINGEIVLLTVLLLDSQDTVDNDLLVIDVNSAPQAPAVVASLGRVGTTLTGLALDAAGDRLLVSNLEPNNRERLAPTLSGRVVANQLVAVDGLLSGAPQLNVIDLDLDDQDALSSPMDVVFDRGSDLVYVAALGSDRIGVIDRNTRTVVQRIPVGRGPRGLALDPASPRLYVLNRTDLSISTVDLSLDVPGPIHTLYPFSPEPPETKVGRNFLYSSESSLEQRTSCASCHVDGDSDFLAWDLGNPGGDMLTGPSNVLAGGNETPNHPVKGPMFTQGLRGLTDHQKFHWRGDRTTLEDFNEAFPDLLDGEPLTDADMAAFAAFMRSIEFSPNPFQRRDRTPLDSRAVAGRELFMGGCNGCHLAAHDGAGRMPEFPDDDQGVDESNLFGQIQEITQLRGLHKKAVASRYTGFGLLHDARTRAVGTLDSTEVFLIEFFGLAEPELGEVAAYLKAFPTNVMPAVGWQVRLFGAISIEQSQEIDRMIALSRGDDSGIPECDIIVHGSLGDIRGGFWLAPGTNPPVFLSDANVVWTLQQIYDAVSIGATAVFSAVPPGSGRRLGIDFDMDCRPNALDNTPRGSPDLNGNRSVDLADLAILLSRFGAPAGVPREQGDIDGDGDVDIADLAELLGYFGTTCP